MLGCWQAFLPENYRNWELKDMKLVWKQVLLDRRGSILPVGSSSNMSNTVGKHVAAFMSVFITRDATDKLRSRQVGLAVPC